jgi:hypothetical protein
MSASRSKTDGVAVALVPWLPRQLEDPGRARRRHADPSSAALHLGVPVATPPSAPTRIIYLPRTGDAGHRDG